MQHDLHPLQPNILSKRDLTDLCEVEDFETGVVLRSTFTFVDENYFAWFGQIPGVRKYDLTIKDLRRSLIRISDDIIYPEVKSGLKVLSDDDNVKSYFIKRPKLLCLDNPEETELLPSMLAEEAHILEFITSRPHQNLVRYYGCVSKRGRIVGIALEKYESILQYRFLTDPRDLNIAACIGGIRAGVKHLHSLGLAHNDLNPTNIALDKDDRPVILDFGSCRRFGEKLLSGGTPGWIDEDYSTSAKHHDEIALQKIELWLLQNKPGKADNAHGLSALHQSQSEFGNML